MPFCSMFIDWNKATFYYINKSLSKILILKYELWGNHDEEKIY